MYCTLVFVSALLAVLTPVILLGDGINVIAILIMSGIFLALSMVSYHGTIVNARGYCTMLKQMDEAFSSLHKDG